MDKNNDSLMAHPNRRSKRPWRGNGAVLSIGEPDRTDRIAGQDDLGAGIDDV